MRCISVKIVILTVLFFMQSCIREDTSDCITSALRLSFRYTLNNQNSDLFGSEVHQVAAYIFDAEGKYIGSYLETGDKLISKYIMTIPLPEGSYQAIVFCDNLNTFSAGWVDRETNLFYGELQPEITTVADFRVMLKNKEGTDGYLVPESVPGDLYAGYIVNARCKVSILLSLLYLPFLAVTYTSGIIVERVREFRPDIFIFIFFVSFIKLTLVMSDTL